jgi:transcriptional regulator with XRE-family HTH domain
MAEKSETLVPQVIGYRIRSFRKLRRLTQEQLGKALGCSTSGSAKVTVAKIEQGLMPNCLRLGRIAEILKCSADILLSGSSRDLMEVIRCYVQPPARMRNPSLGAFRVARTFLFPAIGQGQAHPEADLVEAANRLFYLSDHDPQACQRLFEEEKKSCIGEANRLLAARDFRGLLQHLTRVGMGGAPPLGYRGYGFAQAMIRNICEHYIGPEFPADARESAPPLPAIEMAAEALVLDRSPAGEPEYGLQVIGRRQFPEGTLLIQLSGNALSPLAQARQLAVTAAEERQPVPDELVAVWTKKRGFLCLRFRSRDAAFVSFAGVRVEAAETLRIQAEEIIAMRVIVGVLYE